MEQQIAISPRFFKTELDNYACHRTALVRELLQNAADSRGCSVIHLETGENLIACKDNGRGMTREEIESKFLTMGETGKNTSETVGGFGKAKILIAFAQESYEIHSHDYCVKGSGSGYAFHDREYQDGCKFIINTSATDWHYYVRKVVSLSNFRQKIYLNGMQMLCPIVRGRRVRELSFGSVWVNKSQTPQVIVRVNGIFMFARPTQAKAQVIIELTPEISRQVLLSNRDSLVYKYQAELDDFLNELASESLSALRPKNRDYFKIIKTGAAFRVDPINKKEKVEDSLPAEHGYHGGGTTIAAFAPPARQEQGRTETVEIAEAFCEPWLAGTVMSVETSDSDIHRLAKLYDPECWQGGETRLKLLKLWKTVVAYVAACYANKYQESLRYGVGWVFSADSEAQCRKQDGISYFLLNPIDKEGKMRYSVTKQDSFKELLVLAVHEVSHLSGRFHDEQFASTMTDLMIYALKGEAELWRKVREAR